VGAGAKEASTLMAELDLARSVLAKEEAEFMRSGDAVTEAERKAAEAERALEEVRARQAPLREALAGKREQIAAERERACAERERATAAVGASLLALYERIRRGKAPSRSTPARRRLRPLFHGGPDAAPSPDSARRVDRGLRGLRRAPVRPGMIPARWAVTAPPDPRLTAALASDLHIPETLAAILVQRGLAAPSTPRRFSAPTSSGSRSRTAGPTCRWRSS